MPSSVSPASPSRAASGRGGSPTLERASIDPDADRVVRKLDKAGYKAYLVGGCVRDLLVGKKPKDFDVATSATPNEIKATFRNSRIIGRRFRLAHVVFGSKIIETATFRANPREEDDHDLLIRRDNVFGTETEDARRRDFTINGLFYDVEREEVIDHVGGLADLDAKLVRTIGDPDVRFQEDPVRMLRALKFAARLDFGFEPATWKALLRWRGEISKCAAPRLLEEVHRLMRGGAALRSFELMVETGVLAVLSPYLAGLLEGTGAPAKAPPVAATAPKATVARIEYDEEKDLDDPDAESGDDDEEADADDEASDDEIEAAELAAAAEGAQALDVEEQAWHRLWADEPAAKPAAAAPVKLSFVGDRAALAARREIAWATLGSVDVAVAAGREISNAVAIAALLVPFLPLEVKGNEIHAAVNEVAGPIIDQLQVTRRDSEKLRYLLLAYRRLVAARLKGVQAELTGGRELVDDAMVLFEICGRAAGIEPGGEAPVVTASEGRDEAYESGELDENGQRKRRRRRRGGRRR